MQPYQKVSLDIAVQDLPPDKINQVIDFINYLRSRYEDNAPKRGTAEAILQALDQVGPLHFEPGELDQLLLEIQTMREMDLESNE